MYLLYICACTCIYIKSVSLPTLQQNMYMYCMCLPFQMPIHMVKLHVCVVITVFPFQVRTEIAERKEREENNERLGRMKSDKEEFLQRLKCC